MTSAQTMLVSPSRRAAHWAALAAVMITGFLFGGCASKKPVLVAPEVLTAPYDTARGEVLWAVVPLRNESGTTIVNTEAVSDQVVAAASQVRGVRCLPLNRTLASMRSLDLVVLRSPADVKKLAEAMGVDGIIVGSVTAWDPYNPPVVGISLALYARSDAMGAPGSSSAVDVNQLRFQPTDYKFFGRSAFDDAPASVVSEYLDGKNHGVQMDLQRYAKGRTPDVSALEWRRYLTSMDLYAEFAAWHTVGRLLEHEWIRLARPTADGEARPASR